MSQTVQSRSHAPRIYYLGRRTSVLWPSTTRSARLRSGGQSAAIVGTLGLFFSVLMGFAVLLGALRPGAIGLPLAALAVVLGFITLSVTVAHWGVQRTRRRQLEAISYDEYGVETGALVIEDSCTPTDEDVRGIAASGLRLAYTDITNVGYTPHSLYFDTERDGRIEVRMDGVAPTGIEALADAIQPLWKARRAARSDLAETSSARRAASSPAHRG